MSTKQPHEQPKAKRGRPKKDPSTPLKREMQRGRPKGKPEFNKIELDSANLSPVNKTICERFRQIRMEAELTQEAFAKELNISNPYVKGVEQGRFTPSHAVLYDLAVKYRRSMNWIYGLQ